MVAFTPWKKLFLTENGTIPLLTDRMHSNMTSSLSSLIESRFLPFVEKPIRYVGNELNIIRKDLTKVSLHGVLCFPEVYDIGMSHFGIQMLYHIVNSRPDWALSRSFHPWEDAERILRKEKIPLYSLEYLLPLSQADWIGFSVQYELQYVNILNMLDLGGIAHFSKDRDENVPVVIAGGPCMGNPEPIADFIDAFAIGDGEETIIGLCECMEEHKKRKTPRAGLLEALAAIPGVFVPSSFPVRKRRLFFTPDQACHPVRAAKIGRLRAEHYPDKPLVPLMNVVHHRLAVEVMRGCTRGCRFCSAGMYYRPVRERETQDILDHTESACASTGWREIGLLSLSTADYSCITDLLQAAMDMGRRHFDVSMPSTRIDSLTHQQIDMLDAIAKTSSFTLAPEAGSARLRRIINKDFSDEAIFEAVKMLMRRNVQTLKLYFMIGLPTEESGDIDALVCLVESIAAMVRERSHRRAVHITISPFSPKAQTPFQWEAMAPSRVLLEKSRFIKQALDHCRNVKISYHDPEMTFLETVMARGDRCLSALIHEAWQSGARSDAWSEYFDFNRWKKAAEKTSIDMDRYVAAVPLDQPLPWLAVTNGVSEKFLLEERSRAMEGFSTPDCRSGRCNGCGVCDFNKIRSIVIASGQEAGLNRTGAEATRERVDAVPQAAILPHYYRVTYAKTYHMRFLGHRDMMNIFHRAFVASLLPVAYTGGFHPTPRVSFGPPLPFGVSGHAELFDVTMNDSVDEGAIVSINRWLPAGLEIRAVVRLSSLGESLSAIAAAGKYVFLPLFDGAEKTLDGFVENALAQNAITVDASAGDRAPPKDIRPLIRDLRTVNEQGAMGIEAVLSLLPKATCRPSEFVAGLFPDRAFEDFSIHRYELLKRQGEKFVTIAAIM
jgi:radical SAM family uncharacterized protein/radical SAM-linked protein